MHAYTVEPLYVKSGQEVLAADFYRPKTEHKPAVILMAHGLAGLRQFKLVQYAKQFAQAGYAVVLFDYRYWGGSTGRPRELVSISSQLDDWRTMIAHLQERKSIDSRRIILWGTALSGGYVLTLASELKNILPVVSRDDLSFMPTEDSYSGYMSIVHPDYFWSGEIPARVFFNLIRYRPIQEVRKINIPVLFIAAKEDSLMPIASSREAATNIAPYVQYYEWEMKHFDIYHHPWFEKAISTQLEFLHQHIGVSS